MSRLLRFAPLLALAIVACSFNRAEAGRGIVIINHGETVKKVADLPEDLAAKIKKVSGKDVSVGYKYSSFGVFWLDLWTWDGEHCLFDGETYATDVSPDQVAKLMGTTTDQLPKPFFYRFPPLLMIIVMGIAIWIPFAIRGSKVRKKIAERYESLMADQRYKEAVEVFTKQIDANDGAEKPEGDAASEAPTEKRDPVEAAVEHLVTHGVDKDEATENFAFILSVLIANAEDDD